MLRKKTEDFNFYVKIFEMFVLDFLNIRVINRRAYNLMVEYAAHNGTVVGSTPATPLVFSIF